MKESIPSEKQPEYEAISSEILKMASIDQQARQKGNQEETETIDQENQQRLKQIIASHGWPTKSKVGEEASHMAWLILQHADNDPEFQRIAFDAMREAGEKEVSLEDMAYLADRIRVNEGRPQLFGTQWKIDSDQGYMPEEIEDPDRLDERRSQAGMEPFDQYATAIREMYEKWQVSKNQ